MSFGELCVRTKDYLLLLLVVVIVVSNTDFVIRYILLVAKPLVYMSHSEEEEGISVVFLCYYSRLERYQESVREFSNNFSSDLLVLDWFVAHFGLLMFLVGIV